MAPRLFTCPKCRSTYLGHDPLPDCPSCGYDYRERQGIRWDVLVYLLSILGLVSYLLVSSSYRGMLTESTALTVDHGQRTGDANGEKLPGSRPPTFTTPYHETGR